MTKMLSKAKMSESEEIQKLINQLFKAYYPMWEIDEGHVCITKPFAANVATWHPRFRPVRVSGDVLHGVLGSVQPEDFDALLEFSVDLDNPKNTVSLISVYSTADTGREPTINLKLRVSLVPFGRKQNHVRRLEIKHTLSEIAELPLNPVNAMVRLSYDNFLAAVWALAKKPLTQAEALKHIQAMRALECTTFTISLIDPRDITETDWDNFFTYVGTLNCEMASENAKELREEWEEMVNDIGESENAHFDYGCDLIIAPDAMFADFRHELLE